MLEKIYLSHNINRVNVSEYVSRLENKTYAHHYTKVHQTNNFIGGKYHES